MADYNFPKYVSIHDITLRDGIQNLGAFIPTNDKIRLLRAIELTGCRNIEVTSFVSAKWVPQMADAADVLQAARMDCVSYSVLVPNEKGLERAIAAGATEVVAFMSVSDTHNRHNVNLTAEESFAGFLAVANAAKKAGLILRLNLGTVFGCEFEGEISCERTVSFCMRAQAAGFDGVTLCDTTGMSNPKLTYNICTSVREAVPDMRLLVHLHQRNGIEMANTLAALQAGVVEFESAFGGLGGCPFAPGATGNIATELQVELFESLGVVTGMNRDTFAECIALAKEFQRLYYTKKDRSEE